MDTGDADIRYGVDLVSHHLGGDACFFGDRKVASAGARHRDQTFSHDASIAPNTHDSS
jgi:hypothetical protein